MENHEALMWAKQLEGELCEIVSNGSVEETLKERSMMAALRTLIREVEDPNWRDRIAEPGYAPERAMHPVRALAYMMDKVSQDERWLIASIFMKHWGIGTSPMFGSQIYDMMLASLQRVADSLPEHEE